MAPTVVLLPGESHGQRSLLGSIVHRVSKRLSNFQCFHREERMRPGVFPDYLHTNFLGQDGILSTLPWTYILYQIL